MVLSNSTGKSVSVENFGFTALRLNWMMQNLRCFVGNSMLPFIYCRFRMLTSFASY